MTSDHTVAVTYAGPPETVRGRPTLRQHFMSTVAFPSADRLIALGFNPYDAHMMETCLSNERLAALMVNDFGDPPPGVAWGGLSGAIKELREGAFNPGGEFVARFCGALNITPDQLVHPGRHGPIAHGIAEAGVLVLSELTFDDPAFHRVRRMLAGEVEKAWRLGEVMQGHMTLSNREILERIDRAWQRRGREGPLRGFPSHDAIFMRWEGGQRMIMRAFAYRLRRKEGAGQLLQAAQAFRAWCRSPETRIFLAAEANRREIMAFLDERALGLRGDDVYRIPDFAGWWPA
ncbi:MAG: hypothetical protein H6865_06305 [Rhodospirillales bacterium]|nr:hypothetical protein [Alphaproteobacteria bacterium]MCB9987233.1 hypothetical protein [Rhodospirillales bacterium]USO07906.1 MAG: hypothetical protein H6866_01395 [Rhodospirillales bacterium]